MLIYLHDLFSPGDNPTSQNKIFGFVDKTTWPLSVKHGANEVSEFPKYFSSLVTHITDGKLMLSLVKHKQLICTLAHAKFSKTSLKIQKNKNVSYNEEENKLN